VVFIYYPLDSIWIVIELFQLAATALAAPTTNIKIILRSAATERKTLCMGRSSLSQLIRSYRVASKSVAAAQQRTPWQQQQQSSSSSTTHSLWLALAQPSYQCPHQQLRAMSGNGTSSK
jgi:hypothetical protein